MPDIFRFHCQLYLWENALIENVVEESRDLAIHVFPDVAEVTILAIGRRNELGEHQVGSAGSFNHDLAQARWKPEGAKHYRMDLSGFEQFRNLFHERAIARPPIIVVDHRVETQSYGIAGIGALRGSLEALFNRGGTNLILFCYLLRRQCP